MNDAAAHLELANRARAERAEVKRVIRRGDVPLAAVLDPDIPTFVDPIAAKMRVVALVTAVRWVGLGRYRRLIEPIGPIPERVTLAELGPMKASQLAALVRKVGLDDDDG